MVIKNFFKKSTLITILFVVSITTLIFPFLFLPLLPILMFYGFLYLNKGEIKVKVNFEMIIVYLAIVTYIWGVSLNQGIIYDVNRVEIDNIIFIILLVIILGSISLSQFNNFMNLSIKLLSIIVPLVSLFSLFKLYMQGNGVYFNTLYSQEGVYPAGTSLTTDYNMFSFGLIVGLVCLIYLYKNSYSTTMQMIILLAVNLVTLSVVLTGSRRAYVVLLFIAIYFITVFVSKLKHSKKRFTVIVTFIMLCILSFLLIQNVTEEENIFYNDFSRVFERYDTVQNVDEGFGSRFIRWELAYDIINESSMLEILFGQGFSYVKKFQNYFNQSSEDYPHNFILSTLIYSGIIGVLISLMFLLLPLFKLLRIKSLIGNVPLIIYILFLIYFSISGNTIFHVRVFPVFIIIIYCLSINNKKLIMKADD